MKRMSLGVLLCLCIVAVPLFAQVQTGNIFGKVQTKDGSALPGVTVTLTGVGAPQAFVTDANGAFRFLNLSPGTYTLKAELAGFGTSSRSGVTVNIGRNADVSMTLNPTTAESITVTAEAPLLDVRKTGTGADITRTELEKIPSSRDPWTVLQSAPAVQVDRLNVGGNQSGQQSVYLAKGAQVTDNTWNVDGVNITDMGATGSSPTYYDFDSFEEMQVTTGGSDPRIMTPGVQLNMVTKRGTNDIKGSSRYFYTPSSLQTKAPVPAEAVGYLASTNKINYVRDFGAEIGGPIWRDHIWGWLADSENKISNTASQRIGQTVRPDNIILRDKNAKLNAQILTTNSFTGFYTFGDKVRNARSLSSTRPFEAAWHQSGPTKVFKAEDTQIIGSSLYLTGMFSKITSGFGLVANGGIGPTAPSTYRDSGGVWHNSYESFLTNRPQKQYRVDGSRFFNTGSLNHELKFGFGYRDTPVASTSTWPGTGAYWDFSAFGPSDCKGFGAPDNCALAAVTRDRQAGYGEKYNDLYVGDTVLIGDLTLQASVRVDRQKSQNSASLAAASPLIGTGITLPCSPGSFCDGNTNFRASLPALDFKGDPRTLHWNTVSPRIGLTYALGNDRKTLLRAAYNRYVSQIGATVNGASPLGYPSYLYFVGVNKAGDNIVHPNELLQMYGANYVDPLNPTSSVSPVRLDYGMKPPKTDELIAGFEREIMPDLTVGVNLSYRRYTDLVGQRAEKTQGGGDYYTRADFVPLVRNGQQVYAGGTVVQTPTNGGNTFTTPLVPVYTPGPGVPPVSFFAITNLPGYRQMYKGAELTATKRLSHNWMLRGNFSYNDYTQSCGSSFAIPMPYSNTTPGGNVAPFPPFNNCPTGQVTTRSGGSGAFQDVWLTSKWSFNVNGMYQLPWDFNIGASLTGRQGYAAVYRDQVTGLRVPSGHADIILGSVGGTRFANVYEADLRLAKEFRFFNRVGLTVSGDLFNVPNSRTILQRDTLVMQNGKTRNSGYRITEIQSPRVWRLGARLSF